MKVFRNVFVFIGLAGAMALPVLAQETETKVVDEVVAQVNDGVITLSRVKREVKDIVDTEVQQGKKREDAQKAVDDKQGELIANLINEELILQKAKEMGVEKDIDAAVNQRMLDLMKQNNLKTMEQLSAEMEKGGVNPEDYKAMMRKQLTREKVLQQEIQAKLYWGYTGKELKDYFEKHKDRFTQPETVSVSELFLSFAGRDESAVRAKAKELYDKLKAGGNWDTILKENGDPGVVTQGAGKAEKLRVSELNPVLGTPLAGVKAGDYTVPFDAEKLGVVILRVDSREAASNQSVFDENAVRLAMMQEQAPAEQRKFFSKLRGDAYIKISDTYRPLVSPILFADERKDKSN